MVQHRPFGRIGLREVTEFLLSNTRGLTVRAINYGGIITSIRTPDRVGVGADIVLGFRTLDQYVGDIPPFAVSSISLQPDALTFDGVSALPGGDFAPANSRRDLAGRL